jgi:hypothetical protein
MQGLTAFRPEEEELKEWTGENVLVEIADLQSGHTSHIAGMIYARGIIEGSGVVVEIR